MIECFPMLSFITSFLLSLQKGYISQYISAPFLVNLKQTKVMAVKYFYYLAFKYQRAIYLGRFICSILNTRQINLVGFLEPPYSPPTVLILIALSMRVSALSAKHSYFQYLLLKILFLMSLSITCIEGLSAIFTSLLKFIRYIYRNIVHNPLYICLNLIQVATLLISIIFEIIPFSIIFDSLLQFLKIYQIFEFNHYQAVYLLIIFYFLFLKLTIMSDQQKAVDYATKILICSIEPGNLFTLLIIIPNYYVTLFTFQIDFYNYIERVERMNQNELCIDREIPLCCFEKCSSNSTCPQENQLYHQTFFVGSAQKSQNAVKLQVSGNVLSYTWNNKFYQLQLTLAVMQEQLYLRNHEAVFAIKLVDGTGATTFQTFNQSHFVDIYCLLANHCILTGFQKHYKVGQKLGAGSFGKVYNGFNNISNQNVALKVICKEQLKQIKNGLQMVHNQIIALQKLKKFHISPLISTYQTQDCYILVLEKGNGGNLMEFLKNQKPKKCQQFLRSILKQILEFLKLMHLAGIIHRDIKPDNLMCKQAKGTPSIFLCDYGLSINQQYCNKDKNSSCGTLGFVAPQIINQESFNQKCDIFSVGCLAYALSTGKKLFEAKSYFQLKLMLQNQDYLHQKLQSLTGLDFQFRDLLEKMLEHNPGQRISANDALRHKYFKGCESFLLNIGQADFTLRQFIEKKISKYWK